jgi:hypothetical protein
MSEQPMNVTKILQEARQVSTEAGEYSDKVGYKKMLNSVFSPLAKTDYSANLSEVKSEDFEMSFSRIKMDERAKEIIKIEAKTKKRKEDFSEWIAIDQLNYKVAGIEINIFDYLPDGFRLVFNPKAKTHQGTLIYEEKIILFDDDLASIGAMSVILHEVGHVKDFQKLKEMGREDYVEGKDIREAQQAEKLRREREASLFALRKLWPIFKKRPEFKEDSVSFLKNLAYFSYCQSTLSYLSVAKAMDHSARDYDDESWMEDQNNWEAWQKFRESPEYTEWKKMKQFAKINEDDEYGEWLEWIAESGKANEDEFYDKFFS